MEDLQRENEFLKRDLDRLSDQLFKRDQEIVRLKIKLNKLLKIIEEDINYEN